MYTRNGQERRAALISLRSGSAADTLELGKRIGRACRTGSIIALSGGLAAGKTTLTKGIALGLDICDDITSPTFTLLNEYQGRLPLYHFDAYRLSGYDDFENIGGEEALYGKGVCVIEWSERLADALPSEVNQVRIDILPDDDRGISISGPLEGLLS